MERPNLSGISPEIAAYIGALEMNTAHMQEMLDKQSGQLEKMLQRITDLEQILLNMQRMRFGRKSEQIKPGNSDRSERAFRN